MRPKKVGLQMLGHFFTQKIKGNIFQIRINRTVCTLFLICLVWHVTLFSEENSLPKEEVDVKQIEKASEPQLTKDTKSNEDSQLQPRSYGTKRLKTPPDYAKKLSDVNQDLFKDLDWMLVGLDNRVRYEYRENDFRRKDERIDRPFLLRTRAFVSLKDKFDPFRFTIEMEDAQILQSLYEADNREVNRAEPIQAYLELYWNQWRFLKTQPLSLKAGRMAFELVDRRLVAVNEWRNTTNTFQGTRATWGQESNLWNLDLFYLIPLQRNLTKIDEVEKKTEFTGSVFTINFLEKYIQVQANYLGLMVSELSETEFDRNNRLRIRTSRPGKRIHTSGLRFFGLIGDTGFDYDINWVEQSGTNDIAKGIDHKAKSIILDVGYTWQHSSKPRLGILHAQVSGDENPNDQVNQRLDRLYGFARPWSTSDYITMENVRASKLVLEFIPFKNSKIDTAFNRYLLQSPRDRWERANLRDTEGSSGTHIGDEWNFRWITKVQNRLTINLGYAYFKPGEFTINQTSRVDPSHFVYLEISTIFL